MTAKKGTEVAKVQDSAQLANGSDPNTSGESNGIPEPRIRGRFSLYDLPDGGIHIAWLGDGMDESDTQHMEVPGQVIKVAKMASEGKLNPAQMMKEFMGMG